MASSKKSPKKPKSGAGARTTAKSASKSKSHKSDLSAARPGAKRSVSKGVTTAATSSARRKAAAAQSTNARAGEARKTPDKSAPKSTRTAGRTETSKSKATARRNLNQRKTTTVEMRKSKKTVSPQKAEVTRKTNRAAERKATGTRRAGAKPAKTPSVTKATKIAGTTKAVKSTETVADKVKDVAVRAKSATHAVAVAVPKAAPAKAPAPKAAASKPSGSASAILLDVIRRVGEAAAGAKARVVPIADATNATAAPPASEPVNTPTPQPAPAPLNDGSAASAPAVVPQRPSFGSATGRPGFSAGSDSRFHQLQPRSVAKPAGPRPGFKLEEFIVYPAHGVGQIVAIEEQEVAGFKLELYVISFAKDKMTLKVPTPKVVSVGMRKLAEPALVQKALDVLTGRARIKRTMWSRRAQEYEAKINSGDIIAISEVIRDLYRSEAQPEQSYSERQLYEAALDRMAREIGAVQKLTETETLKLIETQLQKGPRRGAKAEGESETESESPDGEVEEAAA
jgi:CarD family transcriptional regulator